MKEGVGCGRGGVDTLKLKTIMKEIIWKQCYSKVLNKCLIYINKSSTQ